MAVIIFPLLTDSILAFNSKLDEYSENEKIPEKSIINVMLIVFILISVTEKKFFVRPAQAGYLSAQDNA